MSEAHKAFDKAVVVDKLRKTFGDFVALHEVSFEVGRGEVLGLLGPNGAGKTTIVDILSTLSARIKVVRWSPATTWCPSRPVCVGRSCSPASRWLSTKR